MNTNPLFLTDTHKFATLANIIQIGSDEKGSFFVTDNSIFYPQGGGQPNDDGYICFDHDQQYKITSARYAEGGAIKHYTETPIPPDLVVKCVAMHIIQESRRINAAYHTVGHWLSQIVCENLGLPLSPSKGHHFPNEAYIEFDGNIECVSDDTLNQIQMAMKIDMQANLKVRAEFGSVDSDIFNSALLPKNFKPPTNKPLRFVAIDDYRWIPCGGTHLAALSELRFFTPTSFYKKSGKVRLTYSCIPWLIEGD